MPSASRYSAGKYFATSSGKNGASQPLRFHEMTCDASSCGDRRRRGCWMRIPARCAETAAPSRHVRSAPRCPEIAPGKRCRAFRQPAGPSRNRARPCLRCFAASINCGVTATGSGAAAFSGRSKKRKAQRGRSLDRLAPGCVSAASSCPRVSEQRAAALGRQCQPHLGAGGNGGLRRSDRAQVVPSEVSTT